jgi:hypothetical protein
MNYKYTIALGTAIAITSLSLTWGCVGHEADSESAQFRASVEPVLVPGNPDCPEGTHELIKIEPVESGSYMVNGDIVTISVDGLYFDWTSTHGIDAVIAKGGPNANIFNYDDPLNPGGEEAFSDTDLSAPINPETQMPYGLSHITFCYDVDLEVHKTAEASFARTWVWDITKTGDQTSLLLTLGQHFIVNYVVNLMAEPIDSDWAVHGLITVTNPADVDATITEIVDQLSNGTDVPVDCGAISFPHTLAPGATLECSYWQNLMSGTDGSNTVTVSTDGPVDGGSFTAEFAFGDPDTVLDECVTVLDTPIGPLGTICQDQLGDDDEFAYAHTIVGEQCGMSSFTNVAKFTTNDTGAMGSDDHTVVIEVACDEVCTLTPGYWKTHSIYGPAPADDTWELLPEGADTEFFGSGMSYIEVLWMPPRGDACKILAHAYIAAKLNQLNGVDTSTIADELAKAEELLHACPGDYPRSKIIALAELLDDFNNGLIGPEHCSE